MYFNLFADEIAGMTKDDPNKSVTRLLLNKTQFSRVIGKGGTCNSHIFDVLLVVKSKICCNLKDKLLLTSAQQQAYL